MSSSNTITIRGITFVPLQESTLDHDAYTLEHARAAGLLTAVTRREGQTDEDLSRDVLSRIFESGRTCQLLAAVLAEQGKEWSREAAEANAALFTAVTDPGEKALLRDALVQLVLAFFASGLASFGTSLSSFSGAPGGASPNPFTLFPPNGGPPNSGSSPTSSAN